jgi:microsomal dipeptidase-like Zn-dependent dipeptidase
MADRLLERGLSEAMIRDVFWNNAMSVLRAAQR